MEARLEDLDSAVEGDERRDRAEEEHPAEAPDEHRAPPQLDPLARERAQHQTFPSVVSAPVIAKNASSREARVDCRPLSVIPAAIACRLSSAAHSSSAWTRTESPSTTARCPA